MEWTEAAKRHADYHRRKCLEVEDWPKLIPEAEQMAQQAGHRRVVIASVVAACKLVQSHRQLGHYGE